MGKEKLLESINSHHREQKYRIIEISALEKTSEFLESKFLIVYFPQ